MSDSLERFFDAVSARPPVRVDVSSAQGGASRTEEFQQPFILVGAHEHADLALKDANVSRRQLYLQVIGGRLFAVHLSTRVPTCFGAEASPAGWVLGGQEIKFGPFVLGFPDAPTDVVREQPVNPLAAGSFAGPPVTLEMKNGKPGANRAAINRTLTLVGNDAICKLRLNSSRVSAIHCSLVRTHAGLWVVDLASTEGVLVNGAPARTALLANGDLLELGGRQLEVQYSVREDVGATAESAPVDGESFGPTEIQLARAAERTPASRSVVPGDGKVNSDITALVVDKFAAYQAQTHQQFQETMDVLLRAFGNLFAEHRAFVDAELARLDELVRILAEQRPTDSGAAARPAELGPAETVVARDLSVPLPPMGNGTSGEEIHAWLQKRVEELDARKSSLWERMSAMLGAKGAPSQARS